MPSESTRAVEIVLNGNPHTLSEAQTVSGLLQSLGVPADRVAVELNRKILKKDQWDSTPLRSGDEVEIVHFVGGG